MNGFEIFLKIWTSPRKVFKFINDNHYQKHVNLLLMVFATTQAFEKYAKENHLDHLFSWTPIGIIILGGMLAYIIYYVYAALISWTGKLFGGQADSKSILRILSYAMIPSILGYVLLILLIIAFGLNIPKPNNISSQELFFYDSIKAVPTIWTMVLFVIGLSEIQKFSIGKSIGNLILPAIFVVLIIFTLASLFISFK